MPHNLHYVANFYSYPIYIQNNYITRSRKNQCFTEKTQKSPICTKNEHQKLTDENFLTNIGLVFVPEITNQSAFYIDLST